MITDKEYLELDKRNPFYNDYSEAAQDREKIIEYNKYLCETFPFLKPKNRWTGLVPEDYDYRYTELDDMPAGWRLAFGIQMCEEIKQALLAAQNKDPNGGYAESWYTTNYNSKKTIPYLEGYNILQIKEKYGTLRWHDNGTTQEIHDIINKYEVLSASTCIICGKKATKISEGWISPYCDTCAKESFEEREAYTKEHYSNYKPARFEEYFMPINKFYKNLDLD